MAGQARATSAYAGLDFIKAAFCPLDFRAMKFSDHPEYQQFRNDTALGTLEVSNALHYPRQFPFTDGHGNRKTGTQIVTAAFGLAPQDFDFFLGLYTLFKRSPELVQDGMFHATVDFLGRQFGLPTTSQKDYLRIRSRIFRFAHVNYTNTAFWNPDTLSHDIVKFGFYNLDSLSRVLQSRRPVRLQIDPTFLRLAGRSKFLKFDYDFYRTLSPAMRRFYLIANRDGWNQRDSTVFLADEFAVHQIGLTDRPELQKHRMQQLRRLLSQAEELDLIRPCRTWDSYFQTKNRGVGRGQLAVRWSRGPALRTRAGSAEQRTPDALENDALFAQMSDLKDEAGKPIDPLAYRRLVATYGRSAMQKHLLVILAQKEHHKGSFQRSEVAAFVDRLQHDYAAPDWYADLQRAERLSSFDKVTPNQLSMEMYETFFKAG